MDIDNGYLTIEQVAELLQVHYNTVYRWVTSGDLPATKFGDSWRILRKDLELFGKRIPKEE